MRHVQCRNRVGDFVAVVLWIDLLKHLGNPAVGVDDERRANDAPVLSPIHRLLLPDAVLLRDAVIDVGNERKRKLMLFLELAMRFW